MSNEERYLIRHFCSFPLKRALFSVNSHLPNSCTNLLFFLCRFLENCRHHQCWISGTGVAESHMFKQSISVPFLPKGACTGVVGSTRLTAALLCPCSSAPSSRYHSCLFYHLLFSFPQVAGGNGTTSRAGLKRRWEKLWYGRAQSTSDSSPLFSVSKTRRLISLKWFHGFTACRVSHHFAGEASWYNQGEKQTLCTR